MFVEFETFRVSGHVGPENDDEEYHYRDDDILRWKDKNIFFNYIQNNLSRINQIKLKKKFDKIEKEIKNSVKKAKKDKVLDFKKSKSLNFVKSYSKK